LREPDLAARQKTQAQDIAIDTTTLPPFPAEEREKILAAERRNPLKSYDPEERILGKEEKKEKTRRRFKEKQGTVSQDA
jgi:hypothetical protein